MSKLNLNFAAISINAGTADSRTPITSEKVARPLREIVATLHESARQAAWQAVMQSIAEMHGERVEAKGAIWLVNDDECARALRVNYNLIQPEYFPSKVVRKMDKAKSREVWTALFQQAFGTEKEVQRAKLDSDGNVIKEKGKPVMETVTVPNLPVFSDDSDDGDEN